MFKLQKEVYSVKNIYKIPSEEGGPESKTQLTSTEKNSCYMIPIMNYLDKLNGDDTKPTKYIMICCVRQEVRFCEQTVETLDFANKIKST